ncbi:hypothetical protein YK56LOC_69450 [Caballeronia sp. HLA56]
MNIGGPDGRTVAARGTRFPAIPSINAGFSLAPSWESFGSYGPRFSGAQKGDGLWPALHLKIPSNCDLMWPDVKGAV